MFQRVSLQLAALLNLSDDRKRRPDDDLQFRQTIRLLRRGRRVHNLQTQRMDASRRSICILPSRPDENRLYSFS